MEGWKGGERGGDCRYTVGEACAAAGGAKQVRGDTGGVWN